MRWFSILLLTFGLAQLTHAANYPCSGSKGGVARCDGPVFVCNDGSISGSKRNCSATGATLTPLKSVNSSGSCPCGGGALCTGPRGGQYCITTNGKKSYKRK
ncbi:hypothetical protein [Pseudomonas sp.]|uniref:hypothetical protein n=1 Tax=Pseudomonas sp. TaxID=306 RepID=UPI00257C7152|nr:hypothetical protein [Pseudomonas sp.]